MYLYRNGGASGEKRRGELLTGSTGARPFFESTFYEYREKENENRSGGYKKTAETY